MQSEFLTSDQVNDFIEQIVRLINLVRGSPNAAYALKTMVNGVAGTAETCVQPEPASSSAVAEAEGTGVQTSRPMSVKEFLKLQSEAGEKDPDDSPPGGAELCSDAEYFTPLSSPDESRRSSIEVLSSELCIFKYVLGYVYCLLVN